MKVDLKNTGKSFGELVGRFDLGEPNINRLHAIARDLLADNQQIIEPILGLISRPDFRSILQRAGSGEGVIQRHALMADLRQIYTSHVVDQLSLFVDGILGIDSEVDAFLGEYDTDSQEDHYDVQDDVYDYDAAFDLEDDDFNEVNEDYFYHDQYRLINPGPIQDRLNISDYLVSASHSQRPDFLIEGVTGLLALIPLVAGSTIILVAK